MNEKPDYTIKIRTKYNKDQIQLSTEWPEAGPFAAMNDSIDKTMVDYINLKDELVRKALIDLGWTPPPEEITIHKTAACGPSETIISCSDCVSKCPTPFSKEPCHLYINQLLEDPEIRFHVECSCGHTSTVQNKRSVLKDTTGIFCGKCGKVTPHSEEIYKSLRGIS